MRKLLMWVVALVLAVVRVLVAVGTIAMPRGGHLAQSYQFAAHAFIFYLAGLWVMHWRMDWFVRTNCCPEGECNYAKMGWLYDELDPQNRRAYAFIFWFLTAVEVGAFLYTKFGA